MSEQGEQWKHFVSSQRVITRRPGFVWDARITVIPGIVAHVHDAYVAGKGILRASALGLATLMELPSTPELARGELMRFFAEAAWYPTALLPSQGVHWQAIDDRSAQATLIDDGITVAMVVSIQRGWVDRIGARRSTRARCGQCDSSHSLGGTLARLCMATRYAYPAGRGSGVVIARGRQAILAWTYHHDHV